ncbi:hypothetical protein [Acinetobacter sp.]|jgi:23S rRNA pseudoU1915 N3-methylase RlmH|uniref:hypothetical protein n=1 Tax=Acinetobacter sp. TaxID=472 RepID=UPI00281FC702|nr:hypothetical protein [Acinetobacter sp.]MDR0237918.1 hypothetical protein [Acinetobacter sp.]
MKYIAGALIVMVLLIGYFINKNNKEDMARLKMAEIQQNTRLMQNKIDEVQAQKESEARINAKALEKSVKERQQAYMNETQKYTTYENVNVQDASDQRENQSISNQYSEQEWKDICKSASLTARTVMHNRQLGHSMSSQFDTLLPNAQPDNKASIENMIKLAYGRTRYSTSENMKRAESEFENEYHLICLRSYS